MPKKLPYTPRSQIRNVLRRYIWLRSRERAACLKRDGYRCRACGRKQSKAKGQEFGVECHHVAGVGNWEALIDAVYEHLLCSPDHLLTLCSDCHDKER
jgi:hypothetical protein